MRWLSVIVLIKSLLVFVVVPTGVTSLPGRYTIGFADLYDLIAANLAEGAGYRVETDTTSTMIREPGYPLLLAGVFRAAGYRLEAAQCVNLAMSVGIAVLLFRLANRVVEDESTARLAVLFFLFHPATVLAELRGGVEIAVVLGLTAFLVALQGALDKDGCRRFLLCGMMLGAVVSVRSTALLFPAALAAFMAARRATGVGRLRALLHSGMVGLAMLAVLIPWTVRNYALSGAFVPTATVQGIAAQEGQYVCERIGSGTPFWQLQTAAAVERRQLATQLDLRFTGPYYQLFYTPADEVRFSEALLEGVIGKYRDQPTLLLRCMAQNVLFFWFLGKTWSVSVLNALLQLPLLLLAALGVVMRWRDGPRRQVEVLVLLMCYFVVMHALVIAHARHSVPVLPLVTTFAAVPAASLLRRHGPFPSDNA